MNRVKVDKMEVTREKAENFSKKVTVVIPHYNSPFTLERALLSVANQTEPAVEIIVVDDSSDAVVVNEARRVVEAFADARLLAMGRNSGPGSARNRGWNEASGEWIAFLDSDEVWHPRKLEIQLAIAEALGDSVEVIGNGRAQISDPAELDRVTVPPELGVRDVSIRSLLLRNVLATSSVMVRREVGIRFSEGRRFSEDYELWLAMVGSGRRTVVVDFPLVGMFKAAFGESGLSAQTWKMILGEYSAFFGAQRSGALTGVQTVCGMSLSTLKSFRRLCLIGFRKVRDLL